MSKNPLLNRANNVINGSLAEKVLTCEVFILVVERHRDGRSSSIPIFERSDPSFFDPSSDPIFHISIFDRSSSISISTQVLSQSSQGIMRTVANFLCMTKSVFRTFWAQKSWFFKKNFAIFGDFSKFGSRFSHNSKFSCPKWRQNWSVRDRRSFIDPYFDLRADPIRPKKPRVERS